jgi:hypothetical protein
VTGSPKSRASNPYVARIAPSIAARTVGVSASEATLTVA